MMQKFRFSCLKVVLFTGVMLLASTAVQGEDLTERAENFPSVNIKQAPDGLVVIVNNRHRKSEEVQFGCDQESNEIVIDLPADSDIPIMDTLRKNPYVKKNGLSSSVLPQEQMIRIRIAPKLKLYCNGIKLVSKFQRYITYLYPAGLDLKLTGANANGFEFDENRPRGEVRGSLSLNFNEPLGNIDLSNAVIAVDNTLTLRLNPRDFLNLGIIPQIFPAKNLAVSSSVSATSDAHIFKFQSIRSAEIGKVKARLIKSPGSSELRIDLTLTIALYESGRRYYEKGDSRKALLYLDAARSEPSSALVSRMSMGTIFWNEDNYEEAVKSFRELIELDRAWEFPDARFFAVKAYYLSNRKLSFDLSAMLKEYLRRCDRMSYPMCSDARELSEQVNEPLLKLNIASKADLKKLVARLSDPKLNFNEVQKNVFHYWATWCPLCLEEMPKIMQYAVAHPNISIYIIAKHDTQKNILNYLIKSGAIRRKNIFYYIDTRDDIMLRQMVPGILANKDPVTPLPISVFMQRDVPFYLTDKLNWTDTELSQIWKLKYRE